MGPPPWGGVGVVGEGWMGPAPFWSECIALGRLSGCKVHWQGKNKGHAKQAYRKRREGRDESHHGTRGTQTAKPAARGRPREAAEGRTTHTHQGRDQGRGEGTGGGGGGRPGAGPGDGTEPEPQQPKGTETIGIMRFGMERDCASQQQEAHECQHQHNSIPLHAVAK